MNLNNGSEPGKNKITKEQPRQEYSQKENLVAINTKSHRVYYALETSGHMEIDCGIFCLTFRFLYKD